MSTTAYGRAGYDFAGAVMERVAGYTFHDENANLAYRTSARLPAAADLDPQPRPADDPFG